MVHAGRQITSGVRYLLIGFLGLKTDCYGGGKGESYMSELVEPLVREPGENAVPAGDRKVVDLAKVFREHCADPDDNGRFQSEARGVE